MLRWLGLAIGKQITALAAEDELLSRQIEYLEYAQTGVNSALLVTGAGTMPGVLKLS